MARDKRFECSFQSDNGTYYRVEIYDNNSTSATLFTPDLGADGFSLTYQTDDNNRFTGLIPSEVKLDVLITQNGEQSVINEIRSSAYGDYDIGIYSSSNDVSYSLYWAGLLLNDISPEEDIAYPRRVSLTAVCGLAPLKDIAFNTNIPYINPTSYQTIVYFRNAFINQIATSTNYWSDTSPTFIWTSVDWTTDEMTSTDSRDPLVASKFNFMAFVEVDDDGSKKYKDSFTLLDNICKAWGMRCFMSAGRWNLIQVNNYDDWTSPSTHYFRTYNKNSVTTPASYGSTSLNLTEGTTKKRYNADFDFLPILRSVETYYNHLQSFDMPFYYYYIDGDTGTAYQSQSNEIAIWNGFIYNGNTYTGSSYSINNSASDRLIISLGNVTQVTGSSILFNRDIQVNRVNNLTFTDVSGANEKVEVRISARFKLVTDATTYYCPISSLVPNQWTTSDFFTTTGSPIGPVYLNDNYSPGVSTVNINLQTEELPADGELFLEIYSQAYYNNYVSALAINSQIEITETTTTTNEDDILIYSAPELSEEQGIKYLIDNEVVIKKYFRAYNSPGGTTIDNGVKFEIPELFIGTGPTSGAVGRIETYNYTTSSWDSGTNATWKAYNTGTGVEFTQLLVEEVLKGQMSGAKVFNGNIKTISGQILHYLNGINIDGTPYIPYQVTYNANEDTWSGEWYGIDLSGNTQTIVVGNLNILPAAQEFELW